MNTLIEPTPSTVPAVGTLQPAVPSPAALPPAVTPPPLAEWFVWACPCCQATLRTVATARRGTCPACGSLIEAPEPPAAAAAPPASPSVVTRLTSWLRRHGLIVVAVGGSLSAVGGGALLLARTQPWTRLLGSASPALSTQPPSTQELREKLHRFLQAPDWAGKREHVLNAARLDRIGAPYYQGRDPEEIKAADFQPWAMPGLDRLKGVAVLRAERPGRRPVLAIFRQADRGWHLDWEMFSQTYDEALPGFLAAPSYPLRTFRTRLTRVFPQDAPDGVFAVQITDLLDAGQRLTVHLPTGTPIMKSIAGGLAGTAPRDATVEVCWARPDPDGAWEPVLSRLVCWGWHGLNGLPEAAAPAAPATNHFITPMEAPLSSPPPPIENAVALTATVASP